MQLDTFDKRVVERLIRQGKITPAEVQEQLSKLPDLTDRAVLATSDEDLLRGMGDMKLRSASTMDDDNED